LPVRAFVGVYSHFNLLQMSASSGRSIVDPFSSLPKTGGNSDDYGDMGAKVKATMAQGKPNCQPQQFSVFLVSVGTEERVNGVSAVLGQLVETTVLPALSDYVEASNSAMLPAESGQSEDMCCRLCQAKQR
jgi:hypothetical protein